MNQKIKILLIGLAVLCAIALVIAFQLNGVNKSLRRDFSAKEQEFQRERQSMSERLSSITGAKKKLEVDFGDLQIKFDSLMKERDELSNKFDLVSKERTALVDKVQEIARQKKELEEEVIKLKESKGTGETRDTALTTVGTKESFDDAYWASILKEKARLELELKSLKKELADIKLKAGKAMEEGRKLELQLKTATEAKKDLERRLVYNEKLSQTLSEDLVREKMDKKSITKQVDSLRSENFELKSRLMVLGGKKTSLESKLADLQQEREILAKRLSELDHILQERVDQIIEVRDDLKEARHQAREASTKESRVVQLKPIVVKADEGASRRSPTISGQVLAINEENNFVIIDVGEDAGVRVGEVFHVYRNQNRVATVEVIQIRKEISAADIKDLTSGSRIKIGDMVR